MKWYEWGALSLLAVFFAGNIVMGAVGNEYNSGPLGFGTLSGAGGKATATRPRDRAIMEGFSGARIEIIPGSKKIRIKGGQGHGIKNSAGSTMPTRTYLRYSSPFQVTDNAGGDETRVVMPFANRTTAGLMSASDKGKISNYKDVLADYGGNIGNAITDALANGYVLVFPEHTYTSAGNITVDSAIDMYFQGGEVQLTANNPLFIIKNDGVHIHGMNVEVPGTNTAPAIKLLTEYATTGWAITDTVLRDVSIYGSVLGASSDTWTGIEFESETTRGFAFNTLDNVSISEASIGLKFTGNGADTSSWFNSNVLNNVYVGGFSTAISNTKMRFTGNKFNGFNVQAWRASSTGIALTYGDSNLFDLTAWDDGASGNTFVVYNLGSATINNNISGYVEYTSKTDNGKNNIYTTNLLRWTDVVSYTNSTKGQVQVTNTSDGSNLQGAIKGTHTITPTSDIATIGHGFFSTLDSTNTALSTTERHIWGKYTLQGANDFTGATRGLDFTIEHNGSGTVALGEANVAVVAALSTGDYTDSFGYKALYFRSSTGKSVNHYSYYSDPNNSGGTAYHFYGLGNFPSYFGGLVESAAGGFKFPDGTIQTTAVSPSGNGLQLTKVTSGTIYIEPTDSVIEVTTAGAVVNVGAVNKQATIISNTSAGNITLQTSGVSPFPTLVGSPITLAAGTFVVIGEDPNNVNTNRVVLTGSNGGTPDLSGYALLAGRATPQQLNLGTASGAATGYLSSTAHATKGKYFLNAAGTITIDEVNTRVGIGASSPATTIDISAATGGAIRTVYTGASGASGSAGYLSVVDDGAAMATDDRLGYYIFGGATDGAGTRANSAAIEAFAESGFGAGSAPTYMVFKTAASGSTTRTERLRINSTGLTYFSNGGGLPSGNMYSNTSTTITVASSGTWYEVDTGATDFTTGDLTGVTHTDHYLVAPVAGKYLIFARGSAKTGAAGDEMAMSVMVNGTVSETCHGHTTAGSATTTENLGCETKLSLAANDQVSLAVQNHTAARNITLGHMSLLIQHVAAQ